MDECDKVQLGLVVGGGRLVYESTKLIVYSFTARWSACILHRVVIGWGRGEGAGLPHSAADTKTHFALPLCHVLFTTSRGPLQTQPSQEIRLNFLSNTTDIIINLVVQCTYTYASAVSYNHWHSLPANTTWIHKLY